MSFITLSHLWVFRASLRQNVCCFLSVHLYLLFPCHAGLLFSLGPSSSLSRVLSVQMSGLSLSVSFICPAAAAAPSRNSPSAYQHPTVKTSRPSVAFLIYPILPFSVLSYAFIFMLPATLFLAVLRLIQQHIKCLSKKYAHSGGCRDWHFLSSASADCVRVCT